MKKNLISWAAVGMTVLGAVLPASAVLALTVPSPNGVALPTSPIQTTSDITNLFCGIVDWIFWGLIVFSIVMFLIGGYRYATASGEPENLRKANKILLYAVVAVLVALVAKGIPFLVSSFIGGQFGANVCRANG